MTGTPEGLTESGFMEKPGIEPATPGLQGIAIIHYTTGASQKKNQPRGKITCPKLKLRSHTSSKVRLPIFSVSGGITCRIGESTHMIP